MELCVHGRPKIVIKKFKKEIQKFHSEKEATVVMFHGGQGLGELPKNRTPNQLYALMSHEPPLLEWAIDSARMHAYFNLTITYMHNSTILCHLASCHGSRQKHRMKTFGTK